MTTSERKGRRNLVVGQCEEPTGVSGHLSGQRGYQESGNLEARPVGSEQGLRLRGSKRGSLGGKIERSGARWSRWGLPWWQFVVSMSGEAYDAQTRGQNLEFRLRQWHTQISVG